MSLNMILGLRLVGYGLFSVFFVLVLFILLISLLTRVFPEKPVDLEQKED